MFPRFLVPWESLPVAWNRWDKWWLDLWSGSFFLGVRAVVLHNYKLKHMYMHAEWLSSVQSRWSDAHAIKLLLYSERFWVVSHEAVLFSEPLLKLLRMLDGTCLQWGIWYTYEGMDRARLGIKPYYSSVKEKYLAICDIVDRTHRRWNGLFHSFCLLLYLVFQSVCFHECDCDYRLVAYALNAFKFLIWIVKENSIFSYS